MVRVTKLELHRTISDIMKKGNLDQLTTKKIRMLCEQKYNIDLTSRKQEIDKIVMAFVSKKSGTNQNAKKDGGESSNSSSYASDEEGSSCSSRSGSQSCSDSECSYSESSDEESVSKNEATKPVNNSVKPVPKKTPVKKTITQVSQGTAVSKQPAKRAQDTPPTNVKKKANTAKQTELDDAAYARQLQAEEWNFRQRTVKKLFRDIPQKKGDKKDQPKKKKASPFLKKCQLSPALAEVIGTSEMSRPEVVQKMWSVVRERNLFDTTNKQYALCDEQLTKIFGKKRVRLIGMMKYLKHHIRDIN